MLTQVSIAIFTFIVTNIDDLLILSVYFADPRYKIKNIVFGQYLGIATLIGISLFGVFLGAMLDQKYVSLLGILPVLLGVKDLLALSRKIESSADDDLIEQKSKYQYLNVALVTIANGGDNIGVYTPLFATTEPQLVFVYALLFFFLTGVLCLLGNWFVGHPLVKNVFEKYGKVILPIFLIFLGLFILKDFFV